MPDWTTLARSIDGRVVLQDDPDIVHALKQFSAGQKLPLPQALIRCGSVDDVRRALEFVRSHDLRFAIRSGGHCFGDHSHCKDVILDVGAMDTFEHRSGTHGSFVRLGPGACGEHLVPALSPLGLGIPTGGCPTVAIGGLSLVGGFGCFGRLHGLAADRVHRLLVVLSDGSAVEASDRRHEDLFWALRGAGAASFGIVAELEIETHRVPEAIAAYGAWPIEQAADVFERWQCWAPLAPVCANISLSLLAPDDPDVGCLVQLHGIILADEEQTAAVNGLAAAFRSCRSRMRVWPIGPSDVAAYAAGLLDHRGKPAWQPSRPYRAHGFQYTRSHFFERPIERQAIDACVDLLRADRAYAEHREIEIVPWGGAYARDVPNAFIHRSARVLMRHTAYTGARATPELRAHAEAWCRSSFDACARLDNGHVYQGYAERTLANWQQAYYGNAYPRLQAIKRRYDPDNFFRHAQSIEPTPQGPDAAAIVVSR